MKNKIIITLLVICLIILAVPTAYAQNNTQYNLTETGSYTEYYDDGSYSVTTIEQSPVSRATAHQILGKKTIDLYNSDDELQWTYTLIGTFTVEFGVSSVCTDSTYTIEIADSNWHLTAHDNSYSGNIAYGTATIKKKVLFITTTTYDIEADVSCDVDGNVS